MVKYVARRHTMPGLRAGSMCTGYGGLDAGVMSVLGAELAWTADNDPGASAVIAHRMPGIPNLGDIRHACWAHVEPVEIVCAGFPCQPVSAAGKQKGMADDRWLWPAITEAISAMAARPRLLVFENVPRLLTIDGGAAISQVVRSLAQLGYVGCHGIYSAADAGAAHLRKRWFLVAADTESIRWPPRGTAADRDRPGPGDPQALPDTQRHGLQGDRPAAGTDQERPPPPGVGRGPADSDHPSFPDPGSPGLERGIASRAWDDPLGHRPTPDSTPGRPALSGSGLDWQEYEPAVRRWEHVSGYPVPYPVEPGKNGNSRMTAQFPEWLMGLPPGWVTDVPGLSRSAQLRVIGNGVVPHQAAMATTSLLRTLLEPRQ